MNIRYFLKGKRVEEPKFREVVGNGYAPYKKVGGGEDDDFPDILKAQIHEMHTVDNMALQCVVRMIDDSIPANIDQYEFVIWIHGNDYREDFRIMGDRAVAEHIMGHDGWWYNPQDGSAGAAICFIGRKDGELHSEQVRGVGWFSDDEHGDHCHANLVYTIEPSGQPPEPHDITVTFVPEGYGWVQSSIPLADIPHGTIIQLTAHPKDDTKKFLKWTGDISASTATVSFTVNDDMAVVANFEDVAPGPDLEKAKEAIKRADAHAVALREDLARALDFLNPGGTT